MAALIIRVLISLKTNIKYIRGIMRKVQYINLTHLEMPHFDVQKRTVFHGIFAHKYVKYVHITTDTREWHTRMSQSSLRISQIYVTPAIRPIVWMVSALLAPAKLRRLHVLSVKWGIDVPTTIPLLVRQSGGWHAAFILVPILFILYFSIYTKVKKVCCEERKLLGLRVT